MNKVQLLSLKNQKAFDICSKKAIRYSSRLFFILVSIIPKNTESNISANSDKSSKTVATRKKIKPASSHIYYGFKISKKFGKAHERNLLRRRIKNIYQELLKPKELDLSIIFVPRKGKIELPSPNQPKRNELNPEVTIRHATRVESHPKQINCHPELVSGSLQISTSEHDEIRKNHPDHLKIHNNLTPSHRLNQTDGFKDEARGAYLNVGEHDESRKNQPDHLKMWLGVKEIPYETLRSEIEKALNWCIKNLQKNTHLDELKDE